MQFQIERSQQNRKIQTRQTYLFDVSMRMFPKSKVVAVVIFQIREFFLPIMFCYYKAFWIHWIEVSYPHNTLPVKEGLIGCYHFEIIEF